MTIHIERRSLLLGSAATAVLGLSGCASLGGFSMTEAIRRLLTLSSQGAFAVLLQPGGFYDSQVARIALPDRLGGGTGNAILSAILQSKPFRDNLQRQLNRAAEKGAERAAPLVTEAIRNISIRDAVAIVKGGGSAATAYLRGEMGSALVDAMLPGVSDGLRLFDNDVISKAVKSVSGFDMGALAADLNVKVDNAIWASIGAEEERIRANPQSTNDPLLIGVFGLGG